VIGDIAAGDLLTALEVNMAAYWSAYGRTDRTLLRATPEVVWFYTGVPVALFNGVVFARLEPDGLRATYADLQAKITAHGAPALWWIGPQATPANIGSLLVGLGAQPAGEVPGMAIDLAALDDRQDPLVGFTIKKVTDAQSQTLWARIAGAGTGFPAAATEALAQIEGRLNDPQYNAQPRYIGYLDGNPVAASALVLDSGVAGIYAVATLPEARRKGIGRLMTVVPLVEARELGYRVGILQASSMGYPIYQKIGFREVCKFRLYVQA
jgi:GNAT superfamily N-acetyltransferase